VETVAVEGDPVPALLEAARKHAAELIVVGNRGLNTLAGRLLGSVPAEVARRAAVDVLIVHTV
jgi:nucleotide-binding universal stress UspA family protein